MIALARPLIIVLAVIALLPATALGLQSADVAGALRTGDVYVAPGTDVGSDAQARLEAAAQRLRAAGRPTKFVVLAQRPDDSVGLARTLRGSLGFGGSVLVLSPGNLGIAPAAGLAPGTSQAAFDAERAALRADPIAGTIAVANRLAAARRGSAAGGNGGSSGNDDGGISGWVVGLLVALVAVGGVGAVLLARRSARARAERRIAEERAALEPLVDALAAEITDLEDEVDVAGARAERARPAHDEAVTAYGEARDALPAAGTSAAVAAVRGTLERGLRAARRARAALDGAPEPTAEAEPLLGGLCAFDPAHGRAVTEVEIMSPAGTPARVPVCRACAEGLERGEQPQIRSVPLGGRQVPYWQGAGLGGGNLFPVLGGALGGILLYDLLTPDVGWGGDMAGMGGDGGGGGDWGGGDFGGGDFGGGDFGGGGDF
jgi:hypothetical protein